MPAQDGSFSLYLPLPRGYRVEFNDGSSHAWAGARDDPVPSAALGDVIQGWGPRSGTSRGAVRRALVLILHFGWIGVQWPVTLDDLPPCLALSTPPNRSQPIQFGAHLVKVLLRDSACACMWRPRIHTDTR